MTESGLYSFEHQQEKWGFVFCHTYIVGEGPTETLHADLDYASKTDRPELFQPLIREIFRREQQAPFTQKTRKRLTPEVSCNP